MHVFKTTERCTTHADGRPFKDSDPKLRNKQLRFVFHHFAKTVQISFDGPSARFIADVKFELG